ncbi:MAG TPA: AAA family ATPase [Vicinamibacterales bacterium]|nr:AAA family ATPase [Vicinamibacterales bacterium]
MNLTRSDIAAHDALGITPDMLARAQVFRVDDIDARERLTSKHPGDLSGILYPYIHPNNGHATTYRLRRDHPEMENGKAKDKYLSAWGNTKHLYFPPACAPLLADVAVDVLVAEAEKSVLAIMCAAADVDRRVLPVGTGGCWGWHGTIGKTEDASGARVDEKGPLPDLALIAWAGRTVIIAFDANAAANSKVKNARLALVKELSKRGATVRVLDIPAEPGVNGPDDFIGLHGAEAFFTLVDKAGTAAADVIIRRASDVPDEKLVKTFGGRLVRGSITLLAGPGEAGKGMFCVETFARFTTGDPFPGEKHRRDPVTVLMCVTEDSEGRVKSRLRAAGADLDRVFFIEGPEVSRGGLLMPSPMMLDDDAGSVVRRAKQVDAEAIFLETMVEHFGDREGTKSRRSTNNEADVRSALSPFRAVCQAAGLYGLGVIHPRKSLEGGVADSISGSAAFRNASRGVFHVYTDPEDESDQPVRLLFTSKANYLARRPPTLRFRILSWDADLGVPCACHDADCGHEGRVVWEEHPVDDRTAEEIWQQLAERNKPRRDVAVQEAEEFLGGLMVNGIIALTPDQIFKTASAEGITKAAVKRAKENLRLVSKKDGFPAVVVGWQVAKEDV